LSEVSALLLSSKGDQGESIIPLPAFSVSFFSDLEQSGYHYLGNHDNVALAVIRGEFEAGVVKMQVAKKYQGLALKILAETPPFPGFMIVGNTKTLIPEQISQIGLLLLEVDDRTRSLWMTGKDGFSIPSDQNFDLLYPYAETHRP
jgi:phosphonate transport system substrate-binding protein